MQQDQSVEFYQIKIMEKQRELSEADTKIKKLEFKHSRDIKEIKIAEERAKELLKQEKIKVDQFAKQALEQQEQNSLLQRRMIQLKNENQRQNQSVRAQYNQIKDEVRSYERILPTHSFLNRLQTTIAQLPTYEELFIKCRETTFKLQALQTQNQTIKKNLDTLKQKMESQDEEKKQKSQQHDKIITNFIQKIQQNELQLKNIREQLVQKQQKIVELKQKEEQILIKFNTLQNDFEELTQKEREIQKNLREELLQKQEALRMLTTQDSERHQYQIETIKQAYYSKQETYCRQIQNLESQLAFALDQLQSQKDKYQDNYRQIKDVIHNLQIKIDEDNLKFEDITRTNHQISQKNISQSHQIEQLKDKLSKLQQELSFKKQTQGKQADLISTIEELGKELLIQQKRLHEQQEEIKCSKYQNQQLVVVNNNFKSELEEIKIKQQGEFLPFDIEGLIKRPVSKNQSYEQQISKSVPQLTNPEIILQEQITFLNSELNRLRKLYAETLEIQKKLHVQIKNNKEIYQKKINSEKQIIDSLKIELQQLKKNCNQNDFQNKFNQLKTDYQKLKILNAKTEESLILQKQHTMKYKNELKELKNEIKQHKKQLIESKSNNLTLTDSYAKEIKQLKTKILSTNITSQKTVQQIISLQKKYKSQITAITTEKNNLADKLVKKNKELDLMLQQKYKYQQTIKQLREISIQQKEIIQSLRQESLQQIRQLELMKEALDRERNQRTLISVPSLQSLHSQMQEEDQENFQNQYTILGEKQSKIYTLSREINDLKEQLQQEKTKYEVLRESSQIQTTDYIQQIITLKVKVAETDLKASEKQYLYSQLKKKHKL